MGLYLQRQGSWTKLKGFWLRNHSCQWQCWVLIRRSSFQLLGQWPLIQRPSMRSTQMLRLPYDIGWVLNVLDRCRKGVVSFWYPLGNLTPLRVDRFPKGASVEDWLPAWRLSLHRAARPVWGRGRLHTGGNFSKRRRMLQNVWFSCQVSENFLATENSSALPGFGFLQQWARLRFCIDCKLIWLYACRYGVFEEHGYPGDQRYPTFYTQQIWTANGPE